MKHRLTRTALFLFLAAFAGCASTPASARSDPDEMTREEIREYAGISNVYDLLIRARPRWLRTRGASRSDLGAGGGIIEVYVNGSRYGTVDALRTMATEGISSIRYVSGSRLATVLTRPSVNVEAAIMIRTGLDGS